MTPHEITEALHEAIRLKLSGWELLLDTERAVAELNDYKFCEGIVSAMKKCTARADELGSSK